MTAFPQHRTPLIGLNTSLEPDAEGWLTGLRPAYWEAVVQAGGVPVLMPQLGDPALIEAFLERVDGFMMIGGDDLSPERLGTLPLPTTVAVDPRRERSDFLLLERLLARKIPTLSICLACQEINVIHGGTLYQDLPFDGPPVLIRHYSRSGGVTPTHPVSVGEDSSLSAIWEGTADVTVNSSHHQAIHGLGAGLRRVAWAPDNLTEGVEVEGQPFFLGVQWHPERMPDDPLQRKLFAALVHKAIN